MRHLVETQKRRKPKNKELRYFPKEMIKNIKVDEVNGYVLRPYLPTEEPFKVKLDKLYSGMKIGREVIKVLRGYFINWFKTERARIYRQLGQLCIYLNGIWLLPENRLVDLMELINTWKQQYKQHYEDMMAFLDGEITPHLAEKMEKNHRILIDENYMRNVRKYLNSQGVKIYLKKTLKQLMASLDERFMGRFTIARLSFSVNMILNAFDKNLKEQLDMYKRQQIEVTDAYYETLRKNMEREMKLKEQEVLRGILEKYDQRIHEILLGLTKIIRGQITKKNLSVLSNMITTIQKDVSSVMHTELPIVNVLSQYVKAYSNGDIEQLQEVAQKLADDERLPPKIKSALTIRGIKNLKRQKRQEKRKLKRQEQQLKNAKNKKSE